MLPMELLREAFRTAQRMPQAIIPIPAGYEIEAEARPSGWGWVFVGFMFGGHLADGSDIPGYNFVTNKGLMWRCKWENVQPLESRDSGWFYLTKDYLYQQIFYGPKPVTRSMRVRIRNTLDQLVYFSQTAFMFELPLEKVLEIFGR